MKCKYISSAKSVRNKIKMVLRGKWTEILDPYSEVGTSDSGIKEGLKRFGCQHIYKTTYNSTEAKIFIDDCLSLGYPVILSVNFTYD